MGTCPHLPSYLFCSGSWKNLTITGRIVFSELHSGRVLRWRPLSRKRISMKISFAKRSDEKELLDRDDIPFADIEKNMQELDFINTWLGGHSVSLNGLKRLL